MARAETSDTAGRRGSRGFTLIEVLLSLSILAVISLCLTPVSRNLLSLRGSKQINYQDETGVYQLQIMLARNTITSVSDSQLTYQTANNDCTLHIVNHKLLSQPGSLDFIHDIDAVMFSVEENIVFMEYERGKTHFKWPIALYYE